MTRLLPILAFFIGFSFSMDAQKYKNPQQYLREFSNQNRKINKKNLLYLKASLKGMDERRVQRYREMMVEQLKESKAAIERLGPYNDYEILQREYVDGLTIFIDAYEKDFGVAEELIKKRYESYKDLKKYYDAVYKAEGEMLKATFKLEAAEDHFAKMHFFNLERDEEVQEEYRMLDEVTLYSRDMTLSFFRVEAEVRNYLGVIGRSHEDSLDIILTDMRTALVESKKEIAEYADFDGNDDLYEETLYYLTEIEAEMRDNLKPLASKLENEFLDEREYRDAQKDLERFVKRHNGLVNDFFETKTQLIEDYLPED
jgi:hypothetical protein